MLLALPTSSADLFATANSGLGRISVHTPSTGGLLVLTRSHEAILRAADNDTLMGHLPFRGPPPSSSNPFDVLYNDPRPLQQGSSHQRYTFPHTNVNTPASYRLPAVLDTLGQLPPERLAKGPGQHLLQPHAHFRVPSKQETIYLANPIVTVIDQPPARSGLVVSRSASLRHRNTIRSRTRMAKKTDAEPQAYSTSSQPGTRKKLDFLFPVHRKTSFKRKAYLKVAASTPKFQLQAEMDAFFANREVAALIRELLPRKVKVYDYSHLHWCNPSLNKIQLHAQISANNDFSFVTAPAISAPVKGTFVKLTEGPRSQRNPFSLQDAIYDKYRNTILANRYPIPPPKFDEIFPDEIDSTLLLPKEVEHINRKLLFELLLRKTMAAKIEYRLRRGPVADRHFSFAYTSSAYSSDSTASSSSRPSGPKSPKKEVIPRLTDLSLATSSETGSINTDDLMQHNASLFLELLPSPQISYSSDIFGSSFKIIHDDDSSPAAPGNILIRPKRSKPDFGRTGSGRLRLTAAKERTRESPKVGSPLQFSSSSKYSSPQKRSTPSWLTEARYIHNFNRAYFAQYDANAKLDDVEKTLFNSTVYQLKPMNRSHETLSSADSHQFSEKDVLDTTAVDLVLESNRTSDYLTDSSFEKHLSSTDKTRNSQSTNNTSVFQSLEEATSDHSSLFADDSARGKGYKKNNASPARSASDTDVNVQALLYHLAHAHRNASALPMNKDTIQSSSKVLSSQSLLETLQKLHQQEEDEPKAALYAPKTLQKATAHPLADIKSVKGSIVDSSGSYTFSDANFSTTRSQVPPLDSIDEQTTVLVAPKAHSPGRLSPKSGGQVLARHDSNSTRSVASYNRRLGELDYSRTTRSKTSNATFNLSNSKA